MDKARNRSMLNLMDTSSKNKLQLEDPEIPEGCIELPDLAEKKKVQKYFDNLYSFLHVDKITPHMNQFDLMKKSKRLLLSNKSYKGYNNYYKNLTSGYCFKLPRVACYPIQRNEKFISLKGVIKKDEKEEEKNSRKIPFQGVSKKRFDSVGKCNLADRDKSEMSMDSEAFLNLIDEYCNKTGVKGKYFRYREEGMINSKPKNKEFFQNYVYKENKFELFNFNEEGKNYFSDTNTKRFVLDNSFPLTGKNLTVLMEFTPVEIVFFRNKGEIYQEIYFPFPFYSYFVGFNDVDFKIMLAYILQYDEEKKQFFINPEKINTAFKMLSKGVFKLFTEESYFENINKFDSQSFMEISVPNSEDKEASTYITYQIKMNLPKFRFSLIRSGVEKVYYMEKGLDNFKVEYFLKKNFKNWDSFLIYSFSLFKNFRWNINKILSITESRNLKVKYKEDKTLSNENSLEYYIQKYLLSFDKTTKNVYDVFLPNDKKEFIFFQICCPKIYIMYSKKRDFKTINLLMQKGANDKNIIRVEKEIKLYLKQAIQLNKMRRAFTVEDLIRKSVNIEKKFDEEGYEFLALSLGLDDLIFNFDESLLKFLEKRGVESEDVYSNSNLVINYNPLSFIWQQIDSDSQIARYFYQMSREDGREFLDIDPEFWSQKIVENFSKYKEGAENLNEIEKRECKKGKYRM